MNLYKSELRRLFKRRLTWIFGICAVAGLLLLTAAMWINSTNDPSPDDVAYAEEQAEFYQAEVDRCKADEEFFETEWGYDPSVDYPDATHEELCEQELGSWGTEPSDHYAFYTFHFDRDGLALLIGVGLVTGLLAMLLAASGIGAEWSSGGLANLLVWHPNRMKVWGAKIAAALSVAAAALIVTTALAFALLTMTAAARGEVGTIDGAWWEDALAQLGRTGVLALGMTLLGASLAMLGRHTAIAGGVIAGYLIVGDLLVRLAGFALEVPFPDRFSLYTWVAAWISGRIELHDWSAVSDGFGDPDIMVISASEAGLLLGGIVLAFTTVATWSFARRDIS